MPDKTRTVNPAAHPEEMFTLYSIPAFDAGRPQEVRGSEIGSSKQVLANNDVLLSKIVPSTRRAWVTAESLNGSRLIGSGEWIVFRSDRIVPEYLRHVLLSDAFYSRYMQTIAGVGGSLMRARPALVARIRIPLPSMGEQQRIAWALDFADALSTKRRKAISHVKGLIESIFHEMFVAGRTEAWPTVTVADIAAAESGSIRTGPFGSQLLHSEFTEKGVTVLGIDNAVKNEFRWGKPRYISSEKYQQLSRYTVHPGDVLITIMGTCGRTAIVPDDIPIAINTKHLCCITLNQTLCLPEYLHAYFLRHPVAASYLSSTAKGAIMAGLNMRIIKDLPVSLPPIELQSEFARRLRIAAGVCNAQRAHRAELDALFASLQDRAFKGDL